MRCSLSGRVEALVVGGQPRRLLPFVNPCSVRIDGTDSWLLLRLRRLRNAAITTQAVMHEDAAPASAAHEMGMKLLDLHIVQLDQFSAKWAQTIDRNVRAVAGPQPLADPQLSRRDPTSAVHRSERVPRRRRDGLAARDQVEHGEAEPVGERGLPNQGYRPGRKTARRQDK